MIKNVQTKCIISGEAPRIRVKNFKRNLPENYSKSTKLAICVQHVNFQKFLGRACPRTPLELSWFNQLQICSAEKKVLEKIWKLCPSPFKNFSQRHCRPWLWMKKIWSVVVGPPTLEMLPPSLVASPSHSPQYFKVTSPSPHATRPSVSPSS